MFSSCLEHNRTDQCQAGLRDPGGIDIRRKVSTMSAYLRRFAGYSVCVWIVLNLGGVMGVVAAEGTSSSTSYQNRLVRPSLVEDHSRRTDGSRRDPFKRIPQPRLSTPKVTTPSDKDSKVVPLLDNPDWRLLGVIHGRDGHQAIIQVSPSKRVLVQTGSELALSGWTIKTISEEEVLLEYLSSAASLKGASLPKTFILSFPTIQ
ncbi:hypothetical protein ACTRXD_06830 [Nitrospira sp. T9]|uniref:hypothetical protein n=1 Tax=unclassified Nitrospira TaxID=2652172 RepID=UPI003F9A3D67